MPNLKIERVKEYSNSGCTWEGDLGVIDHSVLWEAPTPWNFAAGDIYTHLETATNMMMEAYPSATKASIIIGVPVLLFHIPKEGEKDA